jgi:hypothetical protein
MLRSQILCSCVPAPLSYFSAYTFALPFARPTLAAIPMFPARPHPLALSDVSRMPACIPAFLLSFPHAHARLHYPMFPACPLAFPLSFPHAHARLHFHRLLAVSRTLTPARICTAQHAAVRFPHARSPPRSLFPACSRPLAVSRMPVRRHSPFPARSRPLAFALHNTLPRSPFPACPFAAALAVSCMLTPARCFPHARSLPLAVCCTAHSFPRARFLLRLALPPPPRASPPPRLTSASPRSTSPHWRSRARRRTR